MIDYELLVTSRMFSKKKFLIAISIFFIVVILLVAYKVGRTVTIIGSGEDVTTQEIISLFPELPEREEDRIDILLIGIRGFNGGEDEGGNGEFLTDTIILASFNTVTDVASVVSIPRDLYVIIPGYGKEKINAAYIIGESKQGRDGLQLMKALVSNITGVYVDHAALVNFSGFEKIVDHLGGIVIYRDTPFSEPKQWRQDGKDGNPYWRLREEVATSTLPVSSSTTEASATTTEATPTVITEQYWEFYVPAGANIMNSEDVLYYARSRYSSSDFDRMRRQQEVISAIKSKALNLGMLANPVKIFNILDILGDNVRMDISISQMKELMELAQQVKLQDFKQAVLDSSEAGLLVDEFQDGRYVLLPKFGDYSQIRELFRSIVQ